MFKLWGCDVPPLVFEVWGSDVPLVFDVWGSDVPPLVFDVWGSDVPLVFKLWGSECLEMKCGGASCNSTGHPTTEADQGVVVHHLLRGL